MSWDYDKLRALSKETVDALRQYLKDDEGWQDSKRKGSIVVQSKPSPCADFSQGTLYRGQYEIPCSKEKIFPYADPIEGRDCLKLKWDKDFKDITSLLRVDQSLGIVRTITNSAAMGLISPRDFVSLIQNIQEDGCLMSCGVSIESSECPEESKYVRGWNYPCATIFLDVPGKENHTRIVTFIQSDIRGMVPRSLVDSAIPGSMVGFFTNLHAVLKKDKVIDS